VIYRTHNLLLIFCAIYKGSQDFTKDDEVALYLHYTDDRYMYGQWPNLIYQLRILSARMSGTAQLQPSADKAVTVLWYVLKIED